MLDVCFNSKTDFFAYKNWFELAGIVTTQCIYPSNVREEAKITIAIPTYKRAELLREALDSAISQVGFEDYSIIVVDNNPERDDETELLMQHYKESRVAYYKNTQNIYMGGNWNRCIELVNSPWVVLLHDDDTISSVFMLEIAKAIDKFPQAAVIQTKKVNEKDVLLQESQVVDITYTRFGRLDFYKGPDIIGVPTGVAYRRDSVISLGGFPYDKYQGYAFWFHLRCVQDYACYRINLPLTYYHISQQNASNSGALHETWICYEYWLIRDLMRKNHVPCFIYDPYLQQHIVNLESGIRSAWGTHFNFPKEYIRKVDFPAWRYKLSNVYLRTYAKVLRRCQN